MLSLYIFHRIIFLLLIVGSLSCNFNRRAVCFQLFSEHRLQEYSPAHSAAGIMQTGAFKVARLDFLGLIPPKFELEYNASE